MTGQPKRKLILSLSTIPPRFQFIQRTLRTLLEQTLRPDEIRLNLCRSYRRFPGEVPGLPPLPEGVSVRWGEIDYGPATKVLPTIADHRGQDVEILFCDDDQAYRPELVETLVSRRALHPDSCICGRGYNLSERPKGHRYFVTGGHKPRAVLRKKGLWYRALRTASLGLWKPPPRLQDGHVDILEGFGGALVRPGFFPDEVFDIPDILWTVDDPWLSGHLTRRQVPILAVNQPVIARTDKAMHKLNPLGKFVHKSVGRLEADTRCIDYFRETYGIWPGRSEVGVPAAGT